MTFRAGNFRITHDSTWYSQNPWKVVYRSTVYRYYPTQRGAQSYCERMGSGNEWVCTP